MDYMGVLGAMVMYKDPDKQRDANKKAKARQREREGMTITLANVIPQVIPKKTAQGNIRVSKPGDADYEPQCETTTAFIENRPKKPETGKRGKDIKYFADLPPDVQQTIDRMSVVDGKIDKANKAKRTAAAVKYQHLFPDRYHSTGIAI